MSSIDINQLTALIDDIRNQLENIEGWLSAGNTQLALIKAKCLVDAADELRILINKQDLSSWLNN